MEPRQCNDKDELRARFTAWLKTLLRRAKIDYIRLKQRYPKTVTLELTEKETAMPIPEIVIPNGFDFENDKLRAAFMRLSLSKRNILEMFFVEGLEASEVARELGCTIQHVYNLRSKALKELRAELSKGEDDE